MPEHTGRSRPPSLEDSLRSEALGRVVKVLRTLHDLSRRELAAAAGLSYSYLAEIENGAKQPSSRALAAIAEALHLSLSQLLREAEQLAGSDEVLSPLRLKLPSAREAARPGGARERQMRWYRSRREPKEEPTPDTDLRVSEALPAPPPQNGDAVLEELRALLRALSPEDRDRVLDLARRLAEPQEKKP